MSNSNSPAVPATPPPTAVNDEAAALQLTRSFGGIVEHLSSAADHDVCPTTVKAALGPAEAHVTRGSVVRDVANGFLAGLGPNIKGVNYLTLLRIAALAIQGWKDGKSVEEIVKEVIAAFLSGTLMSGTGV